MGLACASATVEERADHPKPPKRQAIQATPSHMGVSPLSKAAAAECTTSISVPGCGDFEPFHGSCPHPSPQIIQLLPIPTNPTTTTNTIDARSRRLEGTDGQDMRQSLRIQHSDFLEAQPKSQIFDALTPTSSSATPSPGGCSLVLPTSSNTLAARPRRVAVVHFIDHQGSRACCAASLREETEGGELLSLTPDPADAGEKATNDAGEFHPEPRRPVSDRRGSAKESGSGVNSTRDADQVS